MSFWSEVKNIGSEVIAKVGTAMHFAENFFGSEASVQKLNTVETVIAEGLKMAGVPAAVVDGASKEFQTVVAAIVAWDKKLGGGVVIPGATPGTPPTP
jgi:hypothetical protein